MAKSSFRLWHLDEVPRPFYLSQPPDSLFGISWELCQRISITYCEALGKDPRWCNRQLRKIGRDIGQRIAVDGLVHVVRASAQEVPEFRRTDTLRWLTGAFSYNPETFFDAMWILGATPFCVSAGMHIYDVAKLYDCEGSESAPMARS